MLSKRKNALVIQTCVFKFYTVYAVRLARLVPCFVFASLRWRVKIPLSYVNTIGPGVHNHSSLVSLGCLNNLFFTNKIPKNHTFEKILRIIKLDAYPSRN